ncbi:MAG: ABC transporter permease, partial [Chitinophagaceae bacterium]
MFNHFLRIALRNLSKNRVYTAINIAGLTVGLAGFIVVLLYLNHELSYDSWSPELQKVYKISSRTDEEMLEQTPAPLAGFLKSKSPEIVASSRVQ